VWRSVVKVRAATRAGTGFAVGRAGWSRNGSAFEIIVGLDLVVKVCECKRGHGNENGRMIDD